MSGKVTAGCLLALLIASFVTPVFNVYIIDLMANAETQLETELLTRTQEGESHPYLDYLDVDSSEEEEMRSYYPYSSGSDELIVGVKNTTQLPELEETIFKAGGTIVDKIAGYGKTVALVVEAPAMHIWSINDQLQKSEFTAYVEPNAMVTLDLIPNDPLWSLQWGPAKIQADYAWNVTTGASELLVAVIDTGIDYTHNDLSANYSPLGYDWANNDTDPMDDHGHGTHCAGIIAAEINNTIGIAGLAQVSIMAEKAMNSSGIGYDSWVAQAIYDAVAVGAKILSMSFGSHQDSQVMHDAIMYAYDNDVLMVASSGNLGMELKRYPAAYGEVVAVSATDQDDDLAVFSNYGPWIELSAPGVHIYSSLPGNAYAFKDGTSMACPHVTGVAALAWAENENLTATEVRRLLKRNADDLDEWGVDPYHGHGRVNALKAVTISLPEHDVAVIGWNHVPRLDPDQSGIFNATVFNYGGSNETEVTVQLQMNETVVDSVNISLLEVDSPTFVSLSWNTTVTGFYNATCYIVQVSGETLTENNVVSSSLLVRFPVTWRVPDDFPTITEAVTSAAWGDTIVVSAGRYIEGQIAILGHGITLTTDGHVILDGQPGSPVLDVQADNVEISGFDIYNGTGFGINLQGSHNTLTNNTVNGGEGICIDGSKGALIHQCTLRGNGDGAGVKLLKANNSTVRESEISNFGAGIDLYGSFDNAIVNNIIKDNGGGVVGFNDDQNDVFISNNLIEGNLFSNNSEAIFLYGAYNNTIYRNNMTQNTRGLETIFASNNTISQNLITDNDERGIHLDDASKHNQIRGNTITDNGVGIYLDGPSPNNILRNNSLARNWYNFGVYLALLESSLQDIDTSNTVDGKPIYYLINRSNEVVPADAGYVALINCTQMTVEGLDLHHNYQGILVVSTSNSSIYNNNITENGYGIHFSSSFNNTIHDNHVADNFDGIQLSYGTGNNTFLRNHFVENSHGARFYGSSDNILYHNSFLNNSLNALTFSGSVNTWDAGYPSGGNYWSDYEGTDLYRGQSQNETGSDGIGDTSHFIPNGGDEDYYPLMKPYAGPHDIGVTELTLSKTVIGHGYSLDTTFKIVNYGLGLETVNFTAYFNATLPLENVFTLTGRNSTVVTCTWNTTDFTLGNYTLSCITEPVLGETDTTDNIAFADVEVCVTMVGDQDADFDVDIFDIVMIADAYGSAEEQPKYNPNCDIDGDGDVDIFDIVAAAGNYGESW